MSQWAREERVAEVGESRGVHKKSVGRSFGRTRKSDKEVA